MKQLEKYYASLTSEDVNPNTQNIDCVNTEDILSMINQEDAIVADAVAKEIPQIAKAVDSICAGIKAGGRLIYVGAGTSGRLGILDASECPPTYGTPPNLVQGYIAGGDTAIRTAVEGAEDSSDDGHTLIQSLHVGMSDTVVGITASGAAPYVLGALSQAKLQGATTVGLVTNRNTLVEQTVDICIAPIVGPEVIMGSTRMKSGTAQKLVLNMLTTASMVKLGKVYRNMMVDLNVSNIKLQDRAIRMIRRLTGCDQQTAITSLEKSDGNVKTSLLMLQADIDANQARQVLSSVNGHLRTALLQLGVA